MNRSRCLTKYPRPLVMVMGVSGSGKTTVGIRLARLLNVPFVDGDDLHTSLNRLKMKSGHPLSDEDRWPWLTRVAERVQKAGDAGLVVACSALKLSYRDFLITIVPALEFMMLRVPSSELRARMLARKDHFMPVDLLDSQLGDLQPLTGAEHGAVIDGVGDPDGIASRMYELLCAQPSV